MVLSFGTLRCILKSHLYIACWFIAACAASPQANFSHTHHHSSLLVWHPFHLFHALVTTKWQRRKNRRNVTFQPIHVMAWGLIRHRMICRHLGIGKCWTVVSLTASFSVPHHHHMKTLLFKFFLEVSKQDHIWRVATLWYTLPVNLLNLPTGTGSKPRSKGFSQLLLIFFLTPMMMRPPRLLLFQLSTQCISLCLWWNSISHAENCFCVSNTTIRCDALREEDLE